MLRPLQLADSSVLVDWEADAVFCAHAGWKPNRLPALADAWWREQILHPDPMLIRLLAVVDGSPVGYADLYGDDLEERELGYLIAPSARWGQGLGSATARTALDHGFRVLGLRRVWAEAVEANEASVRVLRRLGMRPMGDGDVESFLGQPSRYLRFELFQEEWALAST
ncbi:GNAT family N-acetyltransferase [Microbacteriaceae bacterium 4G12]